MAAIDEYIGQIPDPELRKKIADEVGKLKSRKKFGLIFEEHLPECTPLCDMPVRRGSKAALRRSVGGETYRVLSVDGDAATCLKAGETVPETLPLDELVPVAEFGEAIYPCLKPLDTVCNAPGSDLWHTLIEADNYHALQLLEFLCAGKVDCIYIDPPYNNGVSEWKYNNNIVDEKDAYKHSKWLSMMQKRLKIAKRLLNPRGSVLIVTIDDKEYLHLGCLLEELFPEAKMTMVSSVINPAGKAKKGGTDFSKTDEYIFFLQLGSCPVLPETRDHTSVPIPWETFRRHSLANGRGRHGVGACGPNQFYPFYIDLETHRIVAIGDPIPEDVSRFSVKDVEGCATVFPVRDNGVEMNWGAPPDTARELLKNGFLRVGAYSPDAPQPFSIQYLTKGTIKAIRSGKVVLTESSPDGTVNGYFPAGKPKVPTTHWNRPSHNATSHGTDIINRILCGARFDYPKSVYAVRDCLSLFLADKKDALIVDFFAGSGTTLHAVNLMNAVDGGSRRCILVTNNEVSKAEAKELLKRGVLPGDEEWERVGIARFATWPRVRGAILGVDVNGKPLAGAYGVTTETFVPDGTKGRYRKKKTPVYPELEGMRCADGFRANAAFFRLGFLDPDEVAAGRRFAALLPVLWMKAGAHGVCPRFDDGAAPELLILPENRFAVLTDEAQFLPFCEAVKIDPAVETVFLVTDSEERCREMAAMLEDRETIFLYQDYLEHFRSLSAGR